MIIILIFFKYAYSISGMKVLNHLWKLGQLSVNLILLFVKIWQISASMWPNACPSSFRRFRSLQVIKYLFIYLLQYSTVQFNSLKQSILIILKIILYICIKLSKSYLKFCFFVNPSIAIIYCELSKKKFDHIFRWELYVIVLLRWWTWDLDCPQRSSSCYVLSQEPYKRPIRQPGRCCRGRYANQRIQV